MQFTPPRMDSASVTPSWLRCPGLGFQRLLNAAGSCSPISTRLSTASTNTPLIGGHRHAVLDPIVAAERACGNDIGTFNTRSNAVLAMRCRFVSSIEEILDREVTNSEIDKLIMDHGQTKGRTCRDGSRRGNRIVDGGPWFASCPQADA